MRHPLVRWSLIALVAATASACDDPTPSGPNPAPTSGDPTAGRATELPGLVISASRGLTAPAPMAFVSVRPGSFPEGSTLLIRRATGGSTLGVPLVEGGMDPVAVPALPGDELLLDVMQGAVVLDAAAITAIPGIPPIIVRTDPPKRRTSVPVNAMLAVVFSEPIAPPSVTTETIRLRTGGAEVPIILRLRDEGTVVEVQPAAPLRYLTDYTLEIGTGIADLSGDHLPAPETIMFQTVTCVPADTTPFAIKLLPDTLTLPVGTGGGFLVLVDSGARLINAYPDPSLTWSSSDTTIVRPLNGAVDALAIGQAYVKVEYKGDVDSALVIVIESPPPGPFGVFPGGATIPIGFTLQFDVTHPAGTPRPAVTWTSTDLSIITVDDTGTVTALAAGVAYLRAEAGTDVDSAKIEVYDPTPLLGELFVVSPGAMLLQVGDARQLTVVGPYWPAPAVTWSVADAAVASIDAQGVLQATGPGISDVIATFTDGSTAKALVEVVPAGTLGYISLTPTNATVAVGDTLRFLLNYDATAAANYAGANVAWGFSSADGQILRYLGAGAFEALAPGQGDITAYVGPLIAGAKVTVVP